MEFWPENQGQSPLYAKFGTIPGRNCTHNYHDRHQATHYPLYYSEQQDQGRESGYWAAPGSRTEGAPQEYTPWIEPELAAPTSSHFPFILHSHNQQHQDPGEYQPHEARGREWTAGQRTSKEYERGFLRDGWQRRWDFCSPVRNNREVSTKRTDNSYQELEAWAARYSHSLPRRRRIEAELGGASQGLLGSVRVPERDSGIGTDPRVAALSQLRQAANIRESGVWYSGHRLQTSTYYPSQAPAPDTSHMYIKEKTGYQRRMFSQPPGYIAPPPYNSPHKSTTVMHHCDTSWEQEGKRQTYCSQPTLSDDVSVELQYKRKVEKEEDFTKPDGSKTCAEVEGVKHRRQETDVLQAVSPISVQNTTMQHEGLLSLQRQALKAAQNTNDQTSSKIIEGRKFRLNKKTGGMTIFCLVSRIAGITETPSLPICISETKIQHIDLGEVSKGSQDNNDNQINLADEVDFRVPILTEQSNTSDETDVKEKQKEAQTYVESKMHGDILSNKEETGNVSLGKTNTHVNSTFGKESKQPMSVKYPLWREPSFTSRAETGSSPTFSLKVQSEDSESDGPPDQEEDAKNHPADVEVRRLDTKKDTESEESKSLLVIDTTCVVVKMELIPSPKKEHVHYLDYTEQTEHSALDAQSTTSPEANDQAVTTDQNTEKKSLQINDKPETDPHSDLTEERATKSEISSPCMLTSLASETLEERAQRILGIPLYDCITEQQPADATSFLDMCVAEQDEGVKLSPTCLHDAVRQISEETTEEEQSQNHLEAGQTEDAMCLKESDDAKGQVTNEDGEDVAGSQDQPHMSKEDGIDFQLETDIKMPEETLTEDKQFESISGDCKTEQSQENDSSSEHLSSPEDLCNSSMLSHSELIALSYISESNTEEGLDPELAVLDPAENLDPHPETSPLHTVPYTLPEKLPSPLLPESTDYSIDPTSHTEHSPSPPSPSPPPPPLNLIDQNPEATPTTISCIKNQDEPLQIVENNLNSVLEDLYKDMTVEQQSENDQPGDPACVEESNATAEQQTNEPDPRDLLEETLEISKDNDTDVILQLQFKCVKTEDVSCGDQSSMTEKQMDSEDRGPVSSLEITIHQDSMTDSQTHREEHLHNDKEEDASCVEDSYVTEEKPQTDCDEDPADLLQPKIDSEVSQSPSELPSPPHMSHQSATESVPLLQMDPVCPSALNPKTTDNEIPETVPPVYLDCVEDFSPSFPSDSLSNLASSCTAPSQEEGESVSPDLPDKDEPQYPMSLWDAVNRIRKHTAPDSENEEEEVSELWDPESLGEDLSCPGLVVDRNSRKMVIDEAEQQEVLIEESTDDVEGGKIQQNSCHEKRSAHVGEDTLSCTSTSSRSSGDTVIIAEEDQVEIEETTFDEETENEMETYEEFHSLEGERRRSCELKEETAGEKDEEEEQDQIDTNVFCVSEVSTAEV